MFGVGYKELITFALKRIKCYFKGHLVYIFKEDYIFRYLECVKCGKLEKIKIIRD